MNFFDATTGSTSTYLDTWGYAGTTSNSSIYVYTGNGWQRLYRDPAVCSFEPRKQEEITKEDIDALL